MQIVNTSAAKAGFQSVEASRKRWWSKKRGFWKYPLRAKVNWQNQRNMPKRSKSSKTLLQIPKCSKTFQKIQRFQINFNRSNCKGLLDHHKPLQMTTDNDRPQQITTTTYDNRRLQTIADDDRRLEITTNDYRYLRTFAKRATAKWAWSFEWSYKLHKR